MLSVATGSGACGHIWRLQSHPCHPARPLASGSKNASLVCLHSGSTGTASCHLLFGSCLRYYGHFDSDSGGQTEAHKAIGKL